MDGYLVWLRHSMDGIPVRLFPHTKKGRQDACVFAGKLDPMPTAKVRKVLETGCSTPACVWIVEFIGGEPVGSIGSIEY